MLLKNVLQVIAITMLGRHLTSLSQATYDALVLGEVRLALLWVNASVVVNAIFASVE